MIFDSTEMAANSSTSNGGDRQPREFEIRRAELVGQIGDVSVLRADRLCKKRNADMTGQSLEQVLTQINALNRSLEGIIEVRMAGSRLSNVL